MLRLLVLDFDGVMTDNRVFVHEDGSEAVFCNRGDGWGIARLREFGVKVVVLSTEKNHVVSARCHKLGIDCIQGADEKLTNLKKLASDLGVKVHEIAYVGNDVNDLECLRWAGTAIVVADAEPKTLPVADIVTRKPGGHGAVREVCDMIIAAIQRKNDTHE
ncbi:MAG: HAD hydrolase family protein [Calditrichaeota bacterium]|nr:HAD hydrolase family protein [Calditrichota bacterium]